MDRADLDDDFDLVLVGGGLQNGLLALSVLNARPDIRIALVEAEARLGGNHTWCVHACDVPVGARAWFEPLVVTRWPAYDVFFPDHARTLASSYAVVTSARFADVVSGAFRDQAGQAGRAGQHCSRLVTGRRVVALRQGVVTLDDDSVLRGRIVVDARGPEPSSHAGRCGYQKFVGLELTLDRDHGLTRPIMMDARCEQRDGFRFFYVLPLAERRLLVEETRFSPRAQLDVSDGRGAVRAYAARFGAISEVLREEIGVLPMPWAMPLPTASVVDIRAGIPVAAGYRGGFFHPATGYSLPVALRVAQSLPGMLDDRAEAATWECFLREYRSQARFALQLNRLLFTGFAETDMWGVLSRFYRLPGSLIERFYAMSCSMTDRARSVVGRPPRGFSVVRALRAARPSAAVRGLT